MPHKIELPERQKAILIQNGYDPDKWVTNRWIATYWGCGVSTVRNAGKKGKIPGMIILSNTGFYPKEAAILNWRPARSAKYTSTELEEIQEEAEEEGVEEAYDLDRTNRKDYFKITMNTVTLEDWRIIVKAAVREAKQGDRHARSWLSDYILGRPVKRVESVHHIKDERFTQEERLEGIKSMFGNVGEIVEIEAKSLEEEDEEADD